MGIITNLRKLLGFFPGQPATDQGDQRKNQSVPGHRKVTTRFFETTGDEQLWYKLCEILWERLPAGEDERYETMKDWNTYKQAVCIIWLWAGDIENGGFNQFYYNPGGDYSSFVVHALQFVGADKFSVLAQQANDTFDKEETKISEYWDGTMEGFSKSYKDNPLTQYDAVFFRLNNNGELLKIITAFIRKNQKQFTD